DSRRARVGRSVRLRGSRSALQHGRPETTPAELVSVVQKVSISIAFERAWITLHVRIPAVRRQIDARAGIVPCPVRQVIRECVSDPICPLATGAKAELTAIAEEHVVVTAEANDCGQRLAF